MVLRQRSITACALGAARRLGKAFPGACWKRTIQRHANDRVHARKSAPRSSRKSGEQKQAVGRSRGGLNTKIHALADVKGRLVAMARNPGLCLPRCRSCMVDLMRLDPSLATFHTRHASASDVGLSRYFWCSLRRAEICSSVPTAIVKSTIFEKRKPTRRASYLPIPTSVGI
jgi:hypothetical protein